DAALALAMARVIVGEGFVDGDFIARHRIGFEKYAEHLKRFTPEWAAAETGLAAADIRRLAREYASVKPSMIVVGGASMYKHRHGWEPGRAVATLPALTGQLGLAGGGLGPRHPPVFNGEGARARRAGAAPHLGAPGAGLAAGHQGLLPLGGPRSLRRRAPGTSARRRAHRGALSGHGWHRRAEPALPRAVPDRR